MRQTSRAVALLLTLESAQARTATITLNDPTPAVGSATSSLYFNPTAASLVTNSVSLNSRTAAYKSRLPDAIFAATQETSPQWKTASYHSAIAAATAGAVTYGAGSTCIACLGGGGVWCSRTYAYLETGAGSTTYNSQVTAAAGSMSNLSGSDTDQTGGAALDQGACCESKATFSTFVGTLSVPAATIADVTSAIAVAAGYPMVASSCPAIKGGALVVPASGTAYAWGNDSSIDDSTTAWSSWWCSNGLFKSVTGSGVKTMNSQQIIQSGTNQRTELAMVGCPQMAAACAQTLTLAQVVSVAAATKIYAMPVTGFSVNDKCTWVVYAVDAAPTFVLQDSLIGATPFGLVSANWQIHNMEYTSASSFTNTQQSLVESPGTSGGYKQTASGLSRDSMLPLFNMPANQFTSLRTWYGQGAVGLDDTTGMSSNWSSPGQAPIVNTKLVSAQLAAVKSQLYGNVANVPVSGNVINTGLTALTATQNYGQYNNIQFDLRQMRYFPAMVAQTVWTAGSALSTQYSTALASYNTAKTTWDAYVAILEKNAKQDAFAALFSPPKAPTVPPLPNMPWVPAKYSGYVRATAAQTKAYALGATVGTTTASPTAQEFWTSLAAAQTVGGWGSFTATIFTFRNGWGKSYGTIGYSGNADNQKMSDVWNYKWTCAAASTTAQPTSQCESTYTAVAGALPTTAQTTTTLQNSTKLFTVVSLWATANTNAALASSATIPTKYAWATNGFQITFTASAWKSGIVGLTPLAANVSPVAAKSLSGIAGAQALAATSAAALAVAAALY